MRIIIAAGLLISLFACNNESSPYQEEIKHIDFLLTQNDSLQKVFASVDSAEVQSEFPRVDSIHKIMTGPTAPQEDKKYWTETIAALEYVHHPYMKYVGDVSKMSKKLQYSKMQILTLRNSLADNKLDSAKAIEYLATETMALQDVALLVRKRIGPVKEAIAVWDTSEARYLELLAKNDSLAQ